MSETDDDDDKGIDLVVPELGDSVTEAMITSWIVRSGDRVTRDQPVVSLSLDKIDVELEAPASGMLVVRHGPDVVVKIGDVIARIVPALPADLSAEARHDALLADVAAAPADDGVRQVYADFLLEAACPIGTWGSTTTTSRGEYIGVVARLKRPQPGDDGEALGQRRAELEALARSTALSLVNVKGEPRVEDGFVVGFHTDLATLEASCERLFSRAPIHALGISGLVRDVADRFLALPRLEQLRELTLIGDGGSLPLSALARIVGSPRLAGVGRLELRQLELGPDEGAALACAPADHLELCNTRVPMVGDRAFERLVITGTEQWTAADLRAAIARPVRSLALSGQGEVPALDGTNPERLELEGYAIEARWAPTLARLSRLTRLELRRCEFRLPADLYATVEALPATVGLLVLRDGDAGRRSIARFYTEEVRARTSAEVIF